MSGENLTPITREEMFLAKAAGQDVEIPEPITRKEMFLRDIAVNGGGGEMLSGMIDGTATEVSDDTVESVRDYAFYGMTSLVNVSLPKVKSIGKYVFNLCNNLALTELPSELTIIGNSAFVGCSKLAVTSLPSGLTKLDNYAFRNCTGLAYIEFKGTPTSISSTAFNSCTNLTVINVPWAEGAVANAPWGATNATINYNYTGE